jgi:hypothetical protein
MNSGPKKPLVVQPKSIQPRKAPVAPPVFRPQPVPLVLQKKERPNPSPAAKSSAVQLARGRARHRDDPRDVAARENRQRYHSRDRRIPPPEDVRVVAEDDGGPVGAVVIGAGMPGFGSMAIYRMMPAFEATTTKQSGPQANGHFWSPTIEYITGYMGSGGKGSVSSVLITIPLACTYFQFLDAAATRKDLHPHNFGSAWQTYFPTRQKGKKGKAALSIKNDGGTPTIVFCKAILPPYLKALMGKPVEHE